MRDAVAGSINDRWRERLHVAVAEHRLHQPAVALPDRPFGGNQAVTEERLQRPVSEAPHIPVLMSDEDMLDVFWAVEQEEITTAAQRHSHRVPVLRWSAPYV